MILLIHGTGDDDRKAENWMPWVAKIMELYGDMVMVIPGVASSQQDDLGAHAMQFMNKLAGARAGRPTQQSNDQGLMSVLRETGSELNQALNVMNGSEEDFIANLCQNKRKEGGSFTSGIKIRIAVASLCAVAYYRRKLTGSQRPIRIIGHSRGGCVAVGIHNVLTSYGIPCNKTLTLDPCHGVDKAVVGMAVGAVLATPLLALGPAAALAIPAAAAAGMTRGITRTKEYFHRIWAGRLVNLPCKKGVGKDWAGFAVYRPPISACGTAAVTNLPLLNRIKHGHMGKIQGLHGNERAKDEARTRLAARMNRMITQRRANARAHLREYFREFVEAGTSDYSDRMEIIGQLIPMLTT